MSDMGDYGGALEIVRLLSRVWIESSLHKKRRMTSNHREHTAAISSSDVDL